jgi:quercetin dioxygenase-like cupin family protein
VTESPGPAAPGGTLLDDLFRRRDEQRAKLVGAMHTVRLEDTVLEDNEMGRMRWYLHPALEDRCIRSTLVFRYEIPPHSATGLQRFQGNQVSYVVSGHGRTVLNGVSHSWEAGDVIGIPVLPDGVEVQHFNDSDEVAMLLAAEPNFIESFTVDMGSGFEQLAPRPEEGYR